MAVRITNDELTYHMGIPTVKRSFDGPVHIPHIAESDVHPEWTIVLSVVVTLLCIYRTVRHIAKPGMKSNSGGVTEDSALMLGEGVFLRDDEDINDWDARKYPKCRPFMGRKGTQFENFERDFGAAMAMDQDDDNDLEETMLGIDVGGDNSNTPATTLPQRRRRAKRLKNLYGHLYRHVADLRLREMMHAAARNDGRAAFQLLEQHCRRDITDLEMFDLNNEWETATFLNTVGISIDTVTSFSRYISGLNARRPAAQRKNDEALTLKLLSCFTPPINTALSLEAHKELRASPGARNYHDANTGQRDYTAAVQAFDELWRSQFTSGAIKAMPARKDSANNPGSVRPDGAVIAYESALINGGSVKKRFSLTDMRGQMMCWNCRGLGHSKANCPSPAGSRPLIYYRAILHEKDDTDKIDEDAAAEKSSERQLTKKSDKSANAVPEEDTNDAANFFSDLYFDDEF